VLESRLQSIVQQQAQDNALQENRLRQALDTATQELLKTKTALADASQRHEELQSQYTHKHLFPCNFNASVTAASVGTKNSVSRTLH
jgi:hypothetical protein